MKIAIVLSILLSLNSICYCIKVKDNLGSFCLGNTYELETENLFIDVTKDFTFNIKISGKNTDESYFYLSNTNTLNKDIITPLNLDKNKSTDYQLNYARPNSLNKVLGGNYCFKFKANKVNSEITKLVFEEKSDSNDLTVMRTVNVIVTSSSRLFFE